MGGRDKNHEGKRTPTRLLVVCLIHATSAREDRSPASLGKGIRNLPSFVYRRSPLEGPDQAGFFALVPVLRFSAWTVAATARHPHHAGHTQSSERRGPASAHLRRRDRRHTPDDREQGRC